MKDEDFYYFSIFQFFVRRFVQVCLVFHQSVAGTASGEGFTPVAHIWEGGGGSVDLTVTSPASPAQPRCSRNINTNATGAKEERRARMECTDE